MKKAFGQTVRDLKREVNKKVLKVPSIEQKILDATSNESWGPHGSLLADIAQATRNHHEYQMIMSIIWKRINDTGKNWRHVYKALIVLEYLVAHGSEHVIDEIKEHAYQISALSDFQYIDSGARDQGNNVRRKSQALVVLVQDKERIDEVRQKAAASRDKFRSPSSTGGMYRPNSYSGTGGYGDRYDGDRYDNRNSYERERGWDSKEDDRYGRNGDSNGRDIDRYSGDSDERNGRDGDRNDDTRGRSPNVDNFQQEISKNSDRDRAYEDVVQYSSRGIDRKFSDQNNDVPPSYEAVNNTRNPVHNGRVDGENSVGHVPKPSYTPPVNPEIKLDTSAFPLNQEFHALDEFDPRNSFTATQPTSASADIDLLGSLSDSLPSNALAIMSSSSGPAHSEPLVTNQPFGDDLFGEPPFKAQPTKYDTPLQGSSQGYRITELPQLVAPMVNSDFGGTLSGITYPTENASNFQQDTDILSAILPLHDSATSQSTCPSTGQSMQSNVPQAPEHYNSVILCQNPIETTLHHNNTSFSGGSFVPAGSVIVPKPSKDNFAPKSTIWAETLNRGLVDLNISGSKINPLSDIGIDFDAINRKEKRMERPVGALATSYVTMGKPMGSGHGRTGVIRPQQNPMGRPEMGMGMSMNMQHSGGYNRGMGSNYYSQPPYGGY